jgi:hypothetical protein
MTKIQSAHECVSSNSCLTLTLNVGTWVFVATCRLNVVDIYD